jgi:hypothetical protein
MMVQEKVSFKFKQPIQQIHHFYPCCNEGVLVIGLKSLGKDALYHFSNDSTLLFQHNFENLVFSMAMMTDSEVMVLEVPLNRVFIVDLNTHQIRYYKYHYFQIDVPCQVEVETFLATNLVCIRENGAVNDNRFKLTYYRYPFEEEKSPKQLVSTFESLENEWNIDYTIRKGNNHSMILWYRQRQDDFFELRMFDLWGLDLKENKVEGNYRSIKIKNTLGVPFNVPKISCAFLNVWEMKRNFFMLHTLSDKTQLNLVN